MTAVELARRTMRARAESACPRCRTTIQVGQRIGLVGAGWCHIRCILGYKAPMIGWHSGA